MYKGLARLIIVKYPDWWTLKECRLTVAAVTQIDGRSDNPITIDSRALCLSWRSEMTNPKPDPKPWTHLWQTCLAFVIIVLFIWMAMKILNPGARMTPDNPPDTSAPVRVAKVANLPAQVSEFASFIRENSAHDRMGLEHNYTRDGIRRLADALVGIVDQRKIGSPGIKDKIAELRRYAEQLQEDPHSSKHADTVREAFTLASDLISSIDRQIAPGLNVDVGDVRQAAQAIDPDKLILDQKAEVETFFKRTSLLLSEMGQHKV